MSNPTEELVRSLNRSEVLGVRFIAEPFAVLRNAVRSVIADEARACLYLCPSGAHGVIEARKDAEFQSILNAAAFNVADGMPVVFMNRILGFRTSERAFGPDVMSAILKDSVSCGATHFFYGGKEGVSEALRDRMCREIPGLRVVGTYCPPFRDLTTSEEEAVAQRINDSGADVIWVGLSTPKQERWISRMRGRLDVKLLCSVGAAFDYHTGSIQPAPALMRRFALEWLFRLYQEPRRLWRRYLEIVPTFAFLAGLQVLRLRRFPVKVPRA